MSQYLYFYRNSLFLCYSIRIINNVENKYFKLYIFIKLYRYLVACQLHITVSIVCLLVCPSVYLFNSKLFTNLSLLLNNKPKRVLFFDKIRRIIIIWSLKYRRQSPFLIVDIVIIIFISLEIEYKFSIIHAWVAYLYENILCDAHCCYTTDKFTLVFRQGFLLFRHILTSVNFVTLSSVHIRFDFKRFFSSYSILFCLIQTPAND